MVDIHIEDIHHTFLLDRVLIIHIRYTWREIIKGDSEFYFFNSFLYKTFKDGGFDKVKKWTKDVDIFTKKYLIIPICEKYVSLQFCSFREISLSSH